ETSKLNRCCPERDVQIEELIFHNGERVFLPLSEVDGEESLWGSIGNGKTPRADATPLTRTISFPRGPALWILRNLTNMESAVFAESSIATADRRDPYRTSRPLTNSGCLQTHSASLLQWTSKRHPTYDKRPYCGVDA
ncbi:MAG: hypothetical protein O2856_17255, partial [Planctomycetota bacterium]|nr:hypothetical protein [Planctomycetota bacterium]